MARTYHVMTAPPNIGRPMEKKRRAVLSNYKADVGLYEGRQLWLERDVVKRMCFRFSISSLVSKLHEFEIASSTNCGVKFADFRPSKCRDAYRPPLIYFIKSPTFQHPGKGPAEQRSSASKITAQKEVNKLELKMLYQT